MAEDLVEKVISFFSGDSNENLSDKEMILRQRYKELADNKYARFYRLKNDEADQSLGQFFYSLYNMIIPARAFMKDVAKITKLRQIVLEAFMDTSITNTVKRLSPSALDERIKTTAPAELIAQIRQDIDKLVMEFNADRQDGINRCYNLVMVYFQLVNFDYPALLKKFDPNFSEGLYSGDPKFSPVKAALLVKDLQDFLAISQNISPDSDWKTLLKLLKLCAGEELITENKFAQMLIGLRDVINSKIMELIIQLGSKNPVWVCKPKIPDEHIAESWLEARTTIAQECINKINRNQLNKDISILVKQVFNNDNPVYLDNYTPAKSNFYHKKDLEVFAYAAGINYLSAFISDYLEKGIHELLDILLIRGQWTNVASSKEMSEALHQLLNMPEAISRLDETLSEEGVDGSRLKAALLRVERDRSQARYINTIIENINETAQELISDAAQHFTVIGKHLKNLNEDIQKKHPELIINWRELNSFSREPLSQLIAADQQKINCFVDLMNLCAQ